MAKDPILSGLAALGYQSSWAALDPDLLARVRSNAQAHLRTNHLRASVVGTCRFSDPAWNIMLDLFVRGLDGATTTVSSACLGAEAPSATALRHLNMLVDKHLVERRPSVTDHRVVFVDLTEEGYSRMIALFS